MSKKPPAIPLFGDAYLADTTHLTTEEHGAYLLLIMAAWRQDDCALPLDDRKLARIAGLSLRKWGSIKATILEFWTLEKGRIYQSRLRKEHDYVRQKSESNRKNAEARWDAQTHENKANGGMPPQCEVDAPSPSPSQEKVLRPNGRCAIDIAPPFSDQDLVDNWNELAKAKGLPTVAKLNTARKRAIGVRRREFPDIADWQRALKCIHDNAWMHGDNDRGWRADFDFLLQPKSFIRLVEGSYDRA